MTPQLASEPFGNVWLLRKVLDWCMGKAGQAQCSQRSWWHFGVGAVLSAGGEGSVQCQAVQVGSVPWGPCPCLG